MENINAVLIEDGLSQKECLIKLNKIAIYQVSILEEQATKVQDCPLHLTTFANFHQVPIVDIVFGIYKPYTLSVLSFLIVFWRNFRN